MDAKTAPQRVIIGRDFTPWRLIGESVRVVIGGKMVRVSHGGSEVAVHERRTGRFERVTDPAHFEGVVGFRSKAMVAPAPAPEPALLRPLLEYEQLIGGRW